MYHPVELFDIMSYTTVAIVIVIEIVENGSLIRHLKSKVASVIVIVENRSLIHHHLKSGKRSDHSPGCYNATARWNLALQHLPMILACDRVCVSFGFRSQNSLPSYDPSWDRSLLVNPLLRDCYSRNVLTVLQEEPTGVHVY
mmetsp:Transcript_26456/g.60945  ORF Transcript_26456/g.60945 Transcript_26456/m.60945 type:complete len:142 (-) Transcript_26456:5-430(-)